MMAYKQEPCPLCGRDMTAIETYPGRGELYCGHCDLTIGGNDAKTPEELIALMDGSEHRQFKAENAKLQAENAELRERLDSLHTARMALPKETRERIEQMVHDEIERCAKPYADKLEAYERVIAEIRKHEQGDQREMMEKPVEDWHPALPCECQTFGCIIGMFRDAGWED